MAEPPAAAPARRLLFGLIEERTLESGLRQTDLRLQVRLGDTAGSAISG